MAVSCKPPGESGRDVFTKETGELLPKEIEIRTGAEQTNSPLALGIIFKLGPKEEKEKATQSIG